MRLTQIKELNKNPEVTGSNPVKYENNNIFLLIFFLINWYIFSLIAGFVLNITINIILVIQLPSTVFLLMLL